MYSTDYNLNDPNKINWITLYKMLSLKHYPEIVKLTKDQYDIIQLKDPYTIYFLFDTKEMFYGDRPIVDHPTSSKYFLTTTHHRNEYLMCVNVRNNNTDNIIALSRYNDPQIAVNHLVLLNDLNTTDHYEVEITNIIVEYLDKTISCHDAIISILSLSRFKNDPRLQDVITNTLNFNANEKQNDISDMLKRLSNTLIENQSNNLFKYYFKIYDEFVKNNYFKIHKRNMTINEISNTQFAKNVINLLMNEF